MDLNKYLSTDAGLTVGELAARIGITNPAQIRQWQHGYAGRFPSPENCLAIETATSGAVTRQDLRPHDAWKIWPDLAHLAPAEQA